MTTVAPSPLPEPTAWQSRGASAALPSRLAAVDALRGAALVGMAVYHLAWDLHAFGLLQADPGRATGWHLLGQLVATLFLALSGVSLTLAQRRGATPGTVLRRLLRLAAAAALVTLVTTLVTSGLAIDFGILHCIVATNLVALSLRRWSGTAVAAVAVGAMAAPLFVHVPGAWAWTGLGRDAPATLDFRPVLPWLGPVLIGMVAGRRLPASPVPMRALHDRWAAGLAWAGRHSLALYLLHQPVLIAGVAILSAASPPADNTRDLRSPGGAAAFLHQCSASCVAAGGDGPVCTATCHCVLTAAVSPTATRPPSIVDRWSGRADPVARAIAACRPAEGGGG